MRTGPVIELLRELCNAHGVSGYEDEVRGIVEQHVRPLVDDIRVDPLGNLIATRKAAAADAPTLMLDAHMDEIGMVVSHVEPSGYLRFALVGGWDERVLPAHAVIIRTREGNKVRGVIGVQPPHIQREEDRKKPYAADALFIDIGARSREEVAAMQVRIGDSAVPFYPLAELAHGAIVAKALDDRAGCAVLIRVLEELHGAGDLPVNVAAVFSTFEEVGARGAHVAAYSVDPQVALILEGTTACDFPGVPEARNPADQGSGPAITIMDRTTHCAPAVVRMLGDVATKNGIPHQYKRPIFGGTDAARVHMARGGVLAGVVSVPCRYIHSPHATLRVEDLENTVRLVTAFARECRSLLD
jgi:tetrahedral aminopeptidase